MIDAETRKAIFCLHEKGMSVRELSRRFRLGRNTVRRIVSHKGEIAPKVREDKIEIDHDLFTRVYSNCRGRVQRVYEILTEEHGLRVSYPTLTRLARELGLSGNNKKRCGRVADRPGEEMQHDTSIYKLKIGEKNRRVVGSILYFRYCKLRYLKFYRSFNRFRMKCFLHEALMHFGYSASRCIIDNTNLARLKGTGKDAVICPEMAHFAAQYHFEFICHEKGHSNRKAGNERAFYTVETNFFAGRQFESLEDLNRQAFEWATNRMANRRIGKSRLIPIHAFEFEKTFLNRLKTFLNRLIPGIPPPYIHDTRCIDQYGYVSYDGNFYFVPGTGRFTVTVLEYSDHLAIYHNREKLIVYPLPPAEVKNQVFKPKGTAQANRQPKNRKRASTSEESKLKSLSPEVGLYLDFIYKQKGIKKHHFIRCLYRLSRKVALPVFSRSLERALKFGICDIQTIERICIIQMKSASYELPTVLSGESYRNRESFIEGEFCDEVDLDRYDELLDEEDD
jgi:transposase